MFELVAVIIVMYVILGTLWLGVIGPAWDAWRHR